MPKEKLPYVRPIVKNGTGLQVSIPAEIIEYLNLNKGDLVEVEISTIPKKEMQNPKDAVIWILSANPTNAQIYENPAKSAPKQA